MNIKRAKNEIKNALKAYLATDEFGAYRIPPIRQRPILLMGPPGIGKTQIMQQIAEETGVGLVSYTLTHHTRQSALGLPFIDKVMLGGEERTVTAYTMSEIIASVYHEMERTGVKEGILFLDEINCISGDAHADDAAVPAVQDLRQSAAACRMGGRSSGKSAGIQQIRAGI